MTSPHAHRSGMRIAIALIVALAVASPLALGAAGLLAVRSAPAPIDPASFRVERRMAPVIVQKWIAADPGPERAVQRLGGRVTRPLPIVGGFAATVPAGAIAPLAGVPGIRALTPDHEVRVMGSTDSSALKSVYPKAVQADDMWKAGVTGRGVTVALVDTGIADAPDLAGRVRPVYDDLKGTWSPCVNLTGESSCADSYGHGTFLAGIIAGSGASSGGAWTGVAPEADLVSIKIAGRDGSADVSNVLAAIQWVVSFRDRYNIRIVNLSLGTDSTQTYRTDPLNYAVERAWDAGIVVVVSASNRGPGAGTISKPGDDPWVITVAAVDDRGTPGLGDDTLPNFSSRGPTAADGIAKPDLAAPGAHMISLRAPGSAVDTQFPNYVDGWYRKGSGTSMSAAVVSGAVALMLQADPTMVPDRVKYALTSTARPAASGDPTAVGSGVLDVHAAAFAAPAGLANQGLDRSSGLGSLDASRGTVQVRTDDLLGTVVGGLLTVQLLLWDPIAYTTGTWNGSSWYGSSWYGSSWYSTSWYGSSWYGSSWYGSSWYGSPDGSSWYGSSWYGSSWYGAWE